MSSKKDDLIVDLLQEVREDQKTHSTILIDLQQKVSKNTVDLTEHKEGVRQNRKRIEVLESPFVYLSKTKTILLTIGSLAGVIFAIIKLIDYFKPTL